MLLLSFSRTCLASQVDIAQDVPVRPARFPSRLSLSRLSILTKPTASSRPQRGGRGTAQIRGREILPGLLVHRRVAHVLIGPGASHVGT